MEKGKPVYNVVSVPPTTDKDVSRLLVQPCVPDTLLKALERETRAQEVYRDDTLSIFHTARTGAALAEMRQDVYSILNGKPQLVYAVTLYVMDVTANETFPVTVYLSTDGEDKLSEPDEHTAVFARALDALPDAAEIATDAPLQVRKFYSYGE